MVSALDKKHVKAYMWAGCSFLVMKDSAYKLGFCTSVRSVQFKLFNGDSPRLLVDACIHTAATCTCTMSDILQSSDSTSAIQN